MGKLKTGFLFLGAALLPVYVFGSGAMQPAHILLSCFGGLTLLTRSVPLTLWLLSLLGIFVYSFMVESFYAITGGEPAFMINSIFFLYNVLLTAAVYVHVRENGLSVLVPGIFMAAAVALATVLTIGINLREMGGTGRAIGTFNNPNQLGYFSVCLLSLTYLFYRNGRIDYWVAAGVFVASVFFAIASLSKAAMIANFVVILLALKPANSRNSLLLWSAGAACSLLVVLHLFRTGTFDNYLFMERLANIADESDSSLKSRGYFAFLEGDAVQMLFGLGAHEADKIVGHEVHSTLGGVFNNYGLTGLLIFSIALVMWAWRLWQAFGFVGLICLAGPAMLYGVTHNGVRFTIFWLLFGASMAIANNRTTARCRDEAYSPPIPSLPIVAHRDTS